MPHQLLYLNWTPQQKNKVVEQAVSLSVVFCENMGVGVVSKQQPISHSLTKLVLGN